MKQTKSFFKLIPWLLLGFVLLKATHVFLEILINIYLIYGFSDGFVLIHFKYYLPIFSFSVTLITSIILILLLNNKWRFWGLNMSKLSTLWFILLTIITIIAQPIIQFIFDEKFKLLYNDLSKSEYLSNLNLDAIFTIKDYCLYGSEWLLFLFIATYYILKKKKDLN
ncbi:hypothetical protein [Winogradskyella sp.]|uniref:hypothetical protein n=1 Tax=Winogradskyella sp. TaxID=1883156 RepID=UPI0025E80D30|nr:hypothetical protein [Winogradskyella sp.]